MYIYTQDSATLSERKKKRIRRKIDKALTQLQSDAMNEKLHTDIGDAYMLLQEYANAEEHYQAAISLLQQGTLSERERKQIIVLYGKILSAVPDHKEAHKALGAEYVAVEQKEKAFRFLLSSAKQAFEDENYELALQCYQQVIDIGKSNPHILERCAEIYLKLGKKKEAVEHYTRIGDLYAQEEKHIEALDYYKKVDAVHPENPENLLKITRIYYAMGWTENAAAELVKLGEYHEKQQNFRDALKYYQNSLRLDPDNNKAQTGIERVNQFHTIDNPWEHTGAYHSSTQALNILEELDKLEDLEHSEEQDVSEEPIFPDTRNDSSETLSIREEHPFVLDLREPEQAPTAAELAEESQEEPQPVPDEAEPEQQPQAPEIAPETQDTPVTEFPEPPAWDDHILDLNMEEDFVLAAGLEDEGEADRDDQTDRKSEGFQQEVVGEQVISDEEEGEETMHVNTAIEFIPEATLEEVIEEEELPENTQSEPAFVPQQNRQPALPVQASSTQRVPESLEKLQRKIEELERQLQSTEEEKYFLQEQFTAQIRELKSHEATLKQEFENAIDEVSKEKNTLEQRLTHITGTYQAARQNAGEVDEERYEAIIAKIQHKKSFLQQHLNTLLKQREENGRYLAEELKNLHSTKERLQNNITYIQQVKGQLEHKINEELREAQEKVLSLTTNTENLQQQIQTQKMVEHKLRAKLEKLNREKESLQDEYIETITALTGENEQLERQLQQLSASKAQAENLLKKKLHGLEHSYQQLHEEYKTTLNSKEQELNQTAQRLSEFADNYVRLEKTLGEIRKERDKLDEMLARETATREMLQERLVEIEEQVDSLEVEGTQLLEQLGEELDRQFTMKHEVTDEFQESLEDLERLLSLQEQEIRNLETIS